MASEHHYKCVGFRKGVEKGFQQGIQQSQVHLYHTELHLTPQQIADKLSITTQEVETILQQQISLYTSQRHPLEQAFDQATSDYHEKELIEIYKEQGLEQGKKEASITILFTRLHLPPEQIATELSITEEEVKTTLKNLNLL